MSQQTRESTNFLIISMIKKGQMKLNYSKQKKFASR